MGPRLCLAVAWAVWTIKPTLNRNDEGPGFLSGPFFLVVPSMNDSLEVEVLYRCVRLRRRILA